MVWCPKPPLRRRSIDVPRSTRPVEPALIDARVPTFRMKPGGSGLIGAHRSGSAWWNMPRTARHEEEQQ